PTPVFTSAKRATVTRTQTLRSIAELPTGLRSRAAVGSWRQSIDRYHESRSEYPILPIRDGTDFVALSLWKRLVIRRRRSQLTELIAIHGSNSLLPLR